jgi:hypothetical protein
VLRVLKKIRLKCETPSRSLSLLLLRHSPSHTAGISVLRLLRVLKMIRLFEQLQSLRILISALEKSVLPVFCS